MLAQALAGYPTPGEAAGYPTPGGRSVPWTDVSREEDDSTRGDVTMTTMTTMTPGSHAGHVAAVQPSPGNNTTAGMTTLETVAWTDEGLDDIEEIVNEEEDE
eukprot:1193071-Prorocentrum_minimum.AAC.3